MAGILLIHGAWHGSWCWDGFAGRLAEHGHDVRTARLRGSRPVPRATLASIPRLSRGRRARGRGVRRAARPRRPLDGRAARTEAPPAPPCARRRAAGLASARERVARGDPARAAPSAADARGDAAAAAGAAGGHAGARARALFFTAGTPQTIVDACHVRLQDESYLAFLDVLAPFRPRPARQRAPMLVLGAARDGIIAAEAVHRTARAYGTRAEIFDGMGHDMMLEPGWERVADRIHDWAR